ncbi:M28 family peptidase [Arthrobacter sp. APC 3897]|uniref:M28 family peptidase n=1 Tax=Arthrobacter sp. APC 3897 TaxID=3035204 RepID=UPI0025B2A775|nr:M28 family peptidase [Arthrobacter sp. APC 3897]MDN3481528.1 M28 family peptidase [Arthrobacter sp. APC 3897]
MKTPRILRGTALAAAVVLTAGTAGPVFAESGSVRATVTDGTGTVAEAGTNAVTDGGKGRHPGKPGHPWKPGKPGKPGKPVKPVKDESAKLRAAVTLHNVFDHLEGLQDAADANGGNRASGTPGYEASGKYIEDQLRRAGYKPVRQDFSYDQFAVTSEALEQTAPTATVYAAGTDFTTMTYSGAGDVTAPVSAVDINLDGDRATTSGCEAEDFTGFAAGSIALMQRGECSFGIKAANAEAAGAAGVVIFNQGNEAANDDRLGLVNGTLGEPSTIPVVGTTFAIGEALAGTDGLELRLNIDAGVQTTNSFNILADTPRGKADRTVVVGAHLDSVTVGSGINDNGSGSAAVLETAIQLAETTKKHPLQNRVRFAFWGGEEDGLVGSDYYVSQLDQAGLDGTLANLNFDMLGSPNLVRFVYDGDGSAFPGSDAPRPTGSDEIERIFEEYFTGQKLASAPTEFSGRSDYSAFILNNIPAGGLFSGAEGIKTEEEAAVFGGTAGEAYDPCYHQECDDLGNINRRGLDQMSDAVAHAVLTFARTDADLRGGGDVRSKRLAPAEVDLQFRGDEALK